MGDTPTPGRAGTEPRSTPMPVITGHRAHDDDRTGSALENEDAITIAVVEAAVPALVAARRLFDRFQAMIRKRKAADMRSWLVLVPE